MVIAILFGKQIPHADNGSCFLLETGMLETVGIVGGTLVRTELRLIAKSAPVSIPPLHGYLCK